MEKIILIAVTAVLCTVLKSENVSDQKSDGNNKEAACIKNS